MSKEDQWCQERYSPTLVSDPHHDALAAVTNDPAVDGFLGLGDRPQAGVGGQGLDDTRQPLVELLSEQLCVLGRGGGREGGREEGREGEKECRKQD